MRPVADYSDPDDWMRDFKKEMDDIGERSKKAQEELAKAKGVGESADGAVKVVMGAKGRVESLQIEDPAYQLGPTKLSAAIILALNRAQANAVAATQDAVARAVGKEQAAEFMARYQVPKEDLVDKSITYQQVQYRTIGYNPNPDD